MGCLLLVFRLFRYWEGCSDSLFVVRPNYRRELFRMGKGCWLMSSLRIWILNLRSYLQEALIQGPEDTPYVRSHAAIYSGSFVNLTVWN
jgi:hypothetical protein